MFSIIQAAGWPIWPLILCSVAALALIIERLSSLRLAKVAPPRLLEEVVSVTRASLPSADVVNKLSDNSVLGTVLASGVRAVIAEPRITETALREVFESAGRAAVLVGIACCAAIALGLVRYGGIVPPLSTMPSTAMAYVKQAGIGGRVLNHYNFGGYLIHAGVPTFIDGRGELFGRDFIRRYADTIGLRGGESLEQLLERNRIDWTFMPPDQPANRLLARLPGWRQAYADEAAVIFVRER